MSLKYGNKPVWVAKNGETFTAISITSKQWKDQGNLWFASKLEYLTYLAIIQFARKAKLLVDVQHQFNYFLLEGNDNASDIKWNIDFYCQFKTDTSHLDYCFIEAKGLELPEYKIKRDMLAILYPHDFQRLIVIKNPEKVDDALIKFLDL